jgi:transcriptional regulator with XRE-family HTH domain
MHVATYFAALVNASPKTQDEIAKESGIESSNTISMIKTGKTKIPLARIPALAKALDVDPKEMFAIALEAYEPELFSVFAKVMPGMLISDAEFRLVQAMRSAARTGILK